MPKSTTELAEFDPAEYLDNPESIQAYIKEAKATGDADFINESLSVTQIAEDALKQSQSDA
ncbi:hypothetical protein NMS32_003992 [Vibrio alginolyticus]|nr:hypothetical protein [Vibrio alginolyticus]